MNKEWLNNIKEYLESCHLSYHKNIAEECCDIVSRGVVAGNTAASTGLCKETSLFLKALISKEFKQTWHIVGGFCLNPEMKANEYIKPSALEGNGPWVVFEDSWHVAEDKNTMFGRHWWLEKDGEILDLTSDQFGHEGITKVGVDDSRYLKFDELGAIPSLADTQKIASHWFNNHLLNSDLISSNRKDNEIGEFNL